MQTLMVLNETEKFYPLEMKIRLLASIKKTFVFAIFDCCRQKLSIKGDFDTEAGNFVFIYGCKPGSGVVRNSELLLRIKEQLQEETDNRENILLLPQAVLFIKNRDPKIEILTGCFSEIQLKWKNT